MSNDNNSNSPFEGFDNNESNFFGGDQSLPDFNDDLNPEAEANPLGGSDVPSFDGLNDDGGAEIPEFPSTVSEETTPNPKKSSSRSDKKKSSVKRSKRPKRKSRPRPEYIPRLPGDNWLILAILGAIAILLAGDFLAFFWYQEASFPFIIVYSLLGGMLALAPILLFLKRRAGEMVNFFDVLLAASLALLLLGCMLVLTAQSIRYGSNYKGTMALSIPSVSTDVIDNNSCLFDNTIV